MNHHHTRSALLTLLIMLICATGAAAAPAASSSRPPVAGTSPELRLVRIGAPTWKPADLHLFAAPIGVAPDYSGFAETVGQLLPLPNHVDGAVGAPHAPPYDRELGQAVAELGYREAREFPAADFSAGRGVYLAWMMLPAPGVTGSSFDFSAGPVIPQAIFPIHASGLSLRNGLTYDQALYTDDIVLDDLFVDGSSHFPIYVADNSDFGPAGTPIAGSYEYRVTLTDHSGQGWNIVARFTVTP